MSGGDYWSEPERVEEFARREPDHRLRELAAEFRSPPSVRVLDLGCAGGRNIRFLAERGFDVWALDAAPGMVERVRRDLEPILGRGEADRRVLLGRMEDLSFAADGYFRIVVALGIYHMAKDEQGLHRALSETERVLAPGGRVLAAVFGPGTILSNRPLEPVTGTPFVYRDPDGDTVCMLTAAHLDGAMAAHGLLPLVPTETVHKERKGSLRVVANGFYARR